MSISPVQAVELVTDQPAGDVHPPGQSPPSVSQTGASGTVAQSNPGTVPGQEGAGATNLPSRAERPQDEVQVQRDSQLQDQVVIKYLDGASGDLILQVPSAEVLSVDRSIYQEFQQQAKLQDETSAAAAVGKGEKSHGY